MRKNCSECPTTDRDSTTGRGARCDICIRRRTCRVPGEPGSIPHARRSFRAGQGACLAAAARSLDSRKRRSSPQSTPHEHGDEQPAYPWAPQFDTKVKTAIEKRDLRSLGAPEKWSSALVAEAHPTLEHYVPILTAWGSRTKRTKRPTRMRDLILAGFRCGWFCLENRIALTLRNGRGPSAQYGASRLLGLS